jgi:glutamine synthetase
MNQKEVREKIASTDEQYLKVAITDLDGILRGKLISKEKALKAIEEDFGMCDVVFGWDSTDALYEGDSITGWNFGFPDAKVTLDPHTLRYIPWDHNVPFLLGDFQESLPEVCPRSILKKIAKKARSMGLETRFAMEFEWFNFTKESEKQRTISEGMFGYSILRSSQFQDYWHDLFIHLPAFDIPIEGLHTETGPGVMEAAIQAQSVLQAADQAVLFKSAVKEIADVHDIAPSFMAKWNTQYPGCSGHLHQSLWRNNNLFEIKDGDIPEILEHYMAGILYLMPSLMPMYAPTINSYKRLIRDTWAPTSISWGIDNRTVALRLINNGPDQSRVELRVPGADNNPYLSMAAALASGLYGIENKLKLDLPETKGNAYKDKNLQHLPFNLSEATNAMKNAQIPKELFGARFVEHFVMTREWEVSQYDKQVSDWEIQRYIESI